MLHEIESKTGVFPNTNALNSLLKQLPLHAYESLLRERMGVDLRTVLLEYQKQELTKNESENLEKDSKIKKQPTQRQAVFGSGSSNFNTQQPSMYFNKGIRKHKNLTQRNSDVYHNNLIDYADLDRYRSSMLADKITFTILLKKLAQETAVRSKTRNKNPFFSAFTIQNMAGNQTITQNQQKDAQETEIESQKESEDLESEQLSTNQALINDFAQKQAEKLERMDEKYAVSPVLSFRDRKVGKLSGVKEGNNRFIAEAYKNRDEVIQETESNTSPKQTQQNSTSSQLPQDNIPQPWQMALNLVKFMKAEDRDVRVLTAAVKCFPGEHWKECLDMVGKYVISMDERLLSAVIDVVGKEGGKHVQNQEIDRENKEIQNEKIFGQKNEIKQFIDKKLSPHAKSTEYYIQKLQIPYSRFFPRQLQDAVLNMMVKSNHNDIQYENSNSKTNSDSLSKLSQTCQDPLDATFALFEIARQNNFLSTVICNTVLTALAKSGKWISCLDMLAEMIQTEVAETQEEAELRQLEKDKDEVFPPENKNQYPKPNGSKCLADHFSFTIVIRALPCTEYILSLNLLQKMQELGMTNNVHSGYAMLWQLSRMGYLQKGVVDSFEGSVKMLEESRGNVFVYEVNDERPISNTDDPHVGFLTNSESDSEIFNNQRIHRIKLSESLLPKRRITQKIEAKGNNNISDTTSNNPKILWKLRNLTSVDNSKPSEVKTSDSSSNNSETNSVPTGMLPLALSPFDIGRQLVNGVFKPSSTILYNEGMFRVAFALLLENANSLSHVGWQTAVRLWRSRPQTTFPSTQSNNSSGQSSLNFGRSQVKIVDLHYRTSLDAHSVATAKVCVFCALIDALQQADHEWQQEREKDRAVREKNQTRKTEKNVQTFDLTGGNSSTSQQSQTTKLREQREQTQIVRMQILTGRGEYRLRKTVLEFINALESYLKIARTVVYAVNEGRISLELHRKVES